MSSSRVFKGVKASSFACTSCQKRKRKCNGDRPCSGCERNGLECIFPPKRTSAKDVTAMEARLEQMESAIERLTNQLASSERQATERSPIASRASASPSSRREVRGDLRNQSSASIYHSSGWARECQPTRVPVNPLAHDMKTRLAVNAKQQRDVEPLTLMVYSLELPDAPYDLYHYLMDSHWCWIQPFYNMVYRPAFISGMSSHGQVDSPYFSSFLFHAILAHSARFCRGSDAMIGYEQLPDRLWSKARDLLIGELDKGSSTSMVQGLLLMSAVENSRGRISQCWSYSGLAFRMLQDLGIHKDSARTELSDQDLECRRRTWWSAYLWDKMLSVYFGRKPVLKESLASPPTVLLDDSTEMELWVPHGLPAWSQTHEVKPGYNSSCFIRACRAATVLHRLLIRYYCDPAPRTEIEQEDLDVMEDSYHLWLDLPVHLRTNPDAFAPHHLIVLSCLIHVIIILSHRPHYGHAAETNVEDRCEASALFILRSLRAYFAAYGDCKFVGLSYFLWTAGTIFGIQVTSHANRLPEALAHFDEARTMLARIARTCAGVQQAVDLMTEQWVKWSVALGPDVEAVAIETASGGDAPPILLDREEEPLELGHGDGGALNQDMMSFIAMLDYGAFTQTPWQ